MSTKRPAHTTKRRVVGPHRPDDATAFLPDPRDVDHPPVLDEVAEELAEEYLQSATSAEEQGEEGLDQFRSEELGGPFIEVEGEDEFASSPDESNPADAEREPFPTAIRVPHSER